MFIKNSKYEKNEFLLVTTTDNKKNSKISVNTKSDGTMVSSFRSPISVISNENVLSFIKEFKPEMFSNFTGDKRSNSESSIEQNPEPPKPISNSASRSPSKLDSLSFITSDVFRSSSFQLSHQSSLDIVNYITNENDFKKAQEKEEKEKKEREEKEREEKEKEKEKEQEKESPKREVIPQIKTNIEKVTSPIKSAIEGFKTEITGSPLSAIARPLIHGSRNVRNDLQSNMNGTVFQNSRFNTYLETLNTINQTDLDSPYTQPLLVSYKPSIKDRRSQLQHMSDIKRYTFEQVVHEYDEDNKKLQELTPMTEEEIMMWLKDASTEDIYENMHKLIGIPRKINIMSKKTTQVTSTSPNYPVFGMEQYYYQEPKAFASLYAKFKNYNVSLYIKDGDLCCNGGKG
ncbi:hypothetical protein PIROE2DRAFT_17960, partial [Piromyces sp. E2]